MRSLAFLARLLSVGCISVCAPLPAAAHPALPAPQPEKPPRSVLEIAQSIPDGGTYDGDSPGFSADITLNKEVIFKKDAHNNVHCVGFTFSTFALASNERDLWSKLTKADIRRMQRIWCGNTAHRKDRAGTWAKSLAADRTWFANKYTTDHPIRTAVLAWLDANNDKTSQAAISAGLETVLNTFGLDQIILYFDGAAALRNVERQAIAVLLDEKLGSQVELAQAQPGDFVQFFRPSNPEQFKGHSVVLIALVYATKPNPDANKPGAAPRIEDKETIIGLNYRSAQTKTGIANNTEFFTDIDLSQHRDLQGKPYAASKKMGSVVRSRTYVGRLNTKSNP